MSDYIYTIDKFGDDALTDSIIEGTVTEIIDKTIDCLGAYAFAYCESLSVADIPYCSYVSSCAFYGCTQLKKISFPACTSVDSRAFAGTGITEITEDILPKLSTITGSYVFEGCASLQIVNTSSI